MSVRAFKDRRWYVGFTFVEILIVLSVSVLIFGIIYNFYFSISHGATLTAEQSEIVRDGRTFIERCVRDLSCAVDFIKVTSKKIVFKRYLREFDFNKYDELSKVSYVLSDDNSILIRSENGRNETILKGYKINPKIFKAYIEKTKTEKFREYNVDSGSNIERKHISYVRIYLNINKRDFGITLITGVGCRPIHLNNLESNWNILQ